MKCLRCEQDNPPQARFCMGCGAGLSQRCGKCGTDLPAEARFCFSCGQAVLAPSPQPSSAPAVGYTPKHLADKILKDRSALEGERRQVSVLFADVAGFTALAEQLDPEEVHRIINRCFELVSEEVHRFEGTINQYTGDGVMALFGAPIAHEDGPRRAVHAALAIQRVLRDYGTDVRERTGRAFEMRIGINTGPVVVGKIGDDLRMDYTAVGDTTNLAARVQQAARPGSVFISDATHRAVAGFFETLDLGDLSVKGHTPIRAWEVLRARGRRARLDVAAERGLTPLVGRERDLEKLSDLFGQVRGGRGQVVSIIGEAGIGKSRLVLEFRRRLADTRHDVTWLEGRCVSFGQAIPFLPIIDQLRENFAIEEFDGEPEIIAKVEHGMRRMGGLEAHIPYLRYLLAVDPGDPAIPAMDAAARRKHVLDAVRALALRGASLRPVVFVFEDLHWVDTSSEEYIGGLVDSVAGAPVMLLLTYRTGYAARFGTRTYHTALTVGSLTEPEALILAGRVLGTDRFPEEWRAALVAKAEGVHLFVEEVTKTLVDLCVVRRDNGGYRVVKGLEEVSVPDTIQGIIMARLDRLGEDGKRTVQLASVIGRQFLRRLLERIAGLSGQLDGLLAELKALEIIYEAGLLPEPAYVFKHAVIQDVAYESLLLQRRRELHRSVALAIEELYPDRLAEHYAELAHHFAHAEEWSKAMQCSAQAGRRAAHAFANAEAAAHFAHALDAASRVVPSADPRVLADLYIQHAAVLMVLLDYEQSVAAYTRARDLARQVGDRQLESEILISLGEVYNFYHRAERALEHLAEAQAIARARGDRASLSVGLATSALTRGCSGDFAGTDVDVDEALTLAPDIGHPRRRAQTLVACGIMLQWTGNFDRALPHLHEAATLAEHEHAGFVWAMAAYGIGHVKLARGDYEDALHWYRRIHEYAFAAGDKAFMSRAPNIVGGVHLELFDLDEGLRLGLEGDEVCQRLSPWPEPRAHSLLKAGLAHLWRGEPGRAEHFFGQMSTLLDRDVWGRSRWHIPLLRAQGELALATGRDDDAWKLACQSLEMSEQTLSHKHSARAQLLQGEILAARGQLEAALRPLTSSVTLAERLGTPREVWMGKAALGQVFARLGRDKDAEVQTVGAAQTIEAVAARLVTPRLRRSFLTAEPVAEVYHALGRRPPVP